MSLASKEPVGLAAGIMSIVNALFPALLAFKVPISGEQQAAIVGLIGVALAFWVRSKVSPVPAAKPDAPSKTDETVPS